MKVNIELVFKLNKVEETNDPEQIQKAINTIANETLKKEWAMEIAANFEEEFHCKIEVIECDLKEIE